MPSPDNKKLAANKYLLIFTISTAFLLSILPLSCFTQEKRQDIELKFTKVNETINSGDLYFNILKIWNNTSSPILGNLAFSGPENWKIISFPTDKTLLNPGDTVYVPIRVSPFSNAIGGVAYIINASFRSSKQSATASAYVTLPSVSKWDFSINKNVAYFTENAPNTTFQIKLSNKGNTNELVKLQYNVGKLLRLNGNATDEVIEFVTLKAFTDTIISRTVTFEKKISHTERVKYENNWKESAINVIASSDMVQKSGAIQLTKLNSVYTNQRAQNSSPLNIDYQVYNLMSTQAIRQNAKLYGSLLFPKNRELQYVAGIQNFTMTDNLESIDVNRQLVYNLRYTDNRNIIQLGYNVNGGTLHAINGRGLTGSLRINRNNLIRYSVTQNPFTHNLGEFVGYSTMVKNISLRTELTHENRIDGSYQATSALMGLGFHLFKYHTLSFDVLGSKSDYMKTLPRDTTVNGLSYRFNYNVKYKKFNLRFNGVNSENNYIQNSGLQQAYLDSRYSINDKFGLSLNGTHNKYSLTRYPYNFYNPVNKNSNDNLRLTVSLTSGNVIYQIGPNYVGSVRQFNNSVGGYKSEYINYQPGIWSSATIKLGGYRSITPNLTVSNIRFYYKTNDPLLENYSFDKNIYYSAGVSYFDEVWRVNAYYTSGSTTDLYRSVLIDDKPVVTRCLQLRPTYENYFFDRKVKVTASLNYAYYMPTGRENTSFNIRYDQYFKKGWNLSVSGFMYSNTRVDQDMGRISTKDLNVFLGISKSFNIQQPRLKYYDYKSIFFNDLDGNRIKSDNEPPVTDILVNIQKERSAAPVPSNIPEIKLITDENGMIAVENLPKDNYRMSFTPLINLQSLYFLNGSEQPYFNDKSRTVYIPLAESYRINGKIVLLRDPNSTEGKINLEGIRITATSPKGETYSVLTDNFGSFVLSVPNADKYTVHVNNVFGEQFMIDADEAIVQFAQSKAINLDFTFMEKARGIQFDGGEFFKFNSLASEDANESAVVDTTDGKDSKSYSVQLLATKNYREPADIKSKFNLKSDVLVQKKDGLYKYYTGNYPTIEDASKAIAKQKLQGTAVEVDRSLLQSSIAVQKPQSKTPTASNKSAVSDSKGQEGAKQPVIAAGRSVEGQAAAQSEDASTATTLASTNKSGSGGKTQLTDKSSGASGVSDKAEPSRAKIATPSVVTPATTPVFKQEPAADSIVNEQPMANKATSNKTVGTPAAKEIVAKKANTTPKADSKPASAKAQGNPVQVSQGTAPALKQEPTSAEIQNGKPSASPNNKAVSEKNVQAPVAKKASVDNVGMASNVTSKPSLTKAKPVLAQPISEKEKAGDQIKNQLAKEKIVFAGKPISEFYKHSTQEKRVVDESQYMYTIQLDATWSFPDPKFYKEKYNLPFDVICVEKNGTKKYYAGKYISKDEAMADIARYGMAGFIVPIEEMK